MNVRARAWSLLAVACVVALAHVCVLPTHGHAATVAPAASHDHDSHHDDEALHSASCDAVRAASVSVPTPIIPVSLVAYPDDSRCRIPANVSSAAPTPAPSPPLFLLHAALLI